ncbi:hypothetical protein N9H39_00650 [Gammaproteobacteria bacterium]|nr:hypothetical protein [Gammaproteobacteria bacterium]|tara:strand:+ start:841 stop:1041 length:201 start_codon:yes stop_codon:yes gene_type:complete
MRNRDLITRKLDQLETTLITLEQIVNRQEPIEVYKSNLSKAQNLIEEMKSMVEMEPMSSDELKYKQ